MADAATSIGIGSIALPAIYWMGKIAFRVVETKLSAKPNGNGENKGTSGALNPSYWKQEFRSALDEKIEQRLLPLLEKLTESHTDMLNMLKDRSMYFQQQTDLLKELVEVSRDTRRRR